jgi:general secretion pathway protein C
MSLPPQTLWFSRFVTFVLALAVGVSATYWVLQWAGAPTALAPSAELATTPVVAQTAAVARALGAGPAMPAPDAQGDALASSRFSLVGVLAQGGAAGAALIAVDGLRPKPFAVGAKVGDVWVLHSVKARQAVLVRPAAPDGQASTGDAGLVLQMPPLAEAKLKP